MAALIPIEHAHYIHIGVQDKYSAATYANNYPCVGKVMYSNKQTVPGDKRIQVQLKGTMTLHGIANLHISGDWKYAEFEVSTTQLDKIWSFMGVDGFWYMQGKRAFPILKNHELKLNIESGAAGATVTWDEVTIDRYSSKKMTEVYAIGHQYRGPETLVRNQSKILLDIDHPVFALYVKTDKPVKGLSLQLNDSFVDVPFIWKEKLQRWEAIFQEIPADGVPLSSEKTINFSRIDSAILHVDHNWDRVRVDVWAISSQLTRIISEMAGLAYCNRHQ